MINAEVLSLAGTKKEKASLPEKIFGAKINLVLMAQAVRVFLSNQRKARAHAQTRAEVERTKAKWFRQKGTGRARHGARSAPIFVGGGKAHGPTGEQNYQKTMPAKMRRAALLSALSVKAKEKEIFVIEGLEKAKKTKEIASLLKKIEGKKKEKFLLVISENWEKVVQVAGNLPALEIIPVKSLNPYRVLNGGKILFSQEALKVMEEK